MQFPLSFLDISLWLAITAIILLTTSEILLHHYGKTRILINKKKLRNATLFVSILFLITVAVRIADIILIP